MEQEDPLADLTPEQKAAVDAIAGALQNLGTSALMPQFQPPGDLAIVAEDENGSLSKSESEEKFFYSVRLPNEFFPGRTAIKQTRTQLGLFLAAKYGVNENLALRNSSMPYVERNAKGRYLNFEITEELHSNLLKALKT